MSLQLKEFDMQKKMKGEDGYFENSNAATFYIKPAWSDQLEIQWRGKEHQRRTGSEDKV